VRSFRTSSGEDTKMSILLIRDEASYRTFLKRSVSAFL
jgi:hypothetical protein